MTRSIYSTLLLTLLITIAIASPAAHAASEQSGTPTTEDLISGKPQVVPIPGKVTMVDIGAHSCVPCKMMAPIIKELSTEYENRAAIVFIDVWEHQGEAKKFGVQAIPTQIFYDAYGIEKYRHTGFMGKEAIVEKLKELGVK